MHEVEIKKIQLDEIEKKLTVKCLLCDGKGTIVRRFWQNGFPINCYDMLEMKINQAAKESQKE